MPSTPRAGGRADVFVCIARTYFEEVQEEDQEVMTDNQSIRRFIRDRFECEKTGPVVFEASPGNHYCFAHLERVIADYEDWKKSKESHDIP